MSIELGFVKNIFSKHFGKISNLIAEQIKDGWEKFKIDSDIAFNQYLNKSFDKYSKIKTILYRTEPKYIYNFFEFPKIVKENERIDSKDVNNLLNISHFLIVQGTGGIGKSTFMKHLFINELEKNDLIPIFIEFKDLNDRQNDYEISDFVFEKLYNIGYDFNRDYLEYALKSGCFLFLLDGYDEISTNKKNVFLKKLTAFCDRYTENYFVVSSRPYTEFVEFERFTVLRLCKLTKRQAISLVSKLEFDVDIKNNFMIALDDKLYNKHQSFASNPLLLNIMLLTYDNYAEIPEKLHLFYANAFETLYSKHDATKGGYKRELKSKLSYDSFKKVFSYFCFVTYLQGKIELTYDELLENFKRCNISNITFDVENYVYDIVNSICLLHKDGETYKFTHRSFQEYFTAIFLKELSDDNMKKFALVLIEKDAHRAKNDEVFDMLYDMSQNRMEQNIFVPLIEKIEEECSEDKYDFYFAKMQFKLFFEYIDEDGVSEIKLVRIANTGCPQVQFLQKYAWRYAAFKERTNKDLSDDLFKLLNADYEYVLGEHIEDSIIREPHIYDMIRSTWIGKIVYSLVDFRSELSSKQKIINLDLDELLV